MAEDEMVGWHHQLNGHEFEQAPGHGEGQGSLPGCSPWGHKESDMTEQLNNNQDGEQHGGRREGKHYIIHKVRLPALGGVLIQPRSWSSHQFLRQHPLFKTECGPWSLPFLFFYLTSVPSGGGGAEECVTGCSLNTMERVMGN